MIEILNVIKFIFPFASLLLFFMLYRTEGTRMLKFYVRMLAYQPNRNFYTKILFLVLLTFNWCCYMSDPNLATLVAAAFLYPLMSFKLSDTILHRLHENKISFLTTLTVSMVCYAVPDLYAVSVFLFVLALAAQFYPTRKAIRLCDDYIHTMHLYDDDTQGKIIAIIYQMYY